MKKRLKYFLFLFMVIIITIPVVFVFSFPNTSKLMFCLISNTLPDSDHIVRIRNDLQSQDSFIKMLTKHEQSTVQRFEETAEIMFVNKYIHKTPTSMFDIHAFHDFWEVWVRTDIINGKPLTSYLVRLGLIKDTNAEMFFSNQCNSYLCKSIMKFLIGAYNKGFDWGVFSPIRLNITEIDETSNISRSRLSLKKWNEMVHKIHNREAGISFMNAYKIKPDHRSSNDAFTTGHGWGFMVHVQSQISYALRR